MHVCIPSAWASNISKSTKSFFVCAVCIEIILFCGAETWTMTKDLQKRLGCNYKNSKLSKLEKSPYKRRDRQMFTIPPVNNCIKRRVVCMQFPLLHMGTVCTGLKIKSYLIYLSGDYTQMAEHSKRGRTSQLSRFYCWGHQTLHFNILIELYMSDS